MTTFTRLNFSNYKMKINTPTSRFLRLPWLSGKESACNAGNTGSTLGSERSSEEEPTPVPLPRKSHGQKSLVGGRVGHDLTTEQQ